MKKFLVAATALSGFLALTGAASAQNYDWTGFYLGVQGGYGFGENDWFAAAVPGARSNEDNFDGFVGGGTAGVNWQTNDIVLGIEGDASFSDMNARSTTSGTFNCAAGCDTDLDWFGTVRGRLGISMGNTLPYVTGGLAVGDAEGSSPGFGTIGDDTLVGFAIGAGVEHAFGNHFSAKVELIHVDLGTLDLPTTCGGNCKTDIEFNVVRAGLNFNF